MGVNINDTSAVGSGRARPRDFLPQTLTHTEPLAAATLAPEELVGLLTGERVRLWPYAPNAGYPPTQLYAVWELFERENLWHRVFYLRDRPDELRTLEHFLPWWDTRHVVLVEDLAGGGLSDLGGVVWFDELVTGLRANINLAYAKRLWGGPAREATHIAALYALRHFGLTALWGLSPWSAILRHALACGWSHHTTLPDWVQIGGKVRPLYMVRLGREQLEE